MSDKIYLAQTYCPKAKNPSHELKLFWDEQDATRWVHDFVCRHWNDVTGGQMNASIPGAIKQFRTWNSGGMAEIDELTVPEREE